MIDIGCEYYVTRFTNLEDYDHVLTNGPWMIGDNYLVIREWVPNFVPEEDHITKLTAWVRIPKLSVEYFNKQFLLQKIGQKIGRVIKVDSTTANVERGQYTRMCIEVDLTKPLLSKFRLNGRIWGIQYEGLRMICFKCGRQGHKEDACELDRPAHQDANPLEPKHDHPHAVKERDFGSWMLVQKPARRSQGRSHPSGTRPKGPTPVEPGTARLGSGSNRGAPQHVPAHNLEGNILHPTPPADLACGSRFRALETIDLNMATEEQNVEVAMDKDIAAHLVSNEVTNSDLVEMDQAPSRQAEANQNGNSSFEAMESIPSGNHVDSSTAGPIAGAQDSLRPATDVTRTGIPSLDSARAQRDDRSCYTGEQASDAGRNPPGPIRDAGDKPVVVPSELLSSHTGRGDGVSPARPSRSPPRSFLGRAMSSLRNRGMELDG